MKRKLETPESYHLAERHIYGSSRVGMITEKVEFEYVYGNQPSEALIATLSFEETVNFELEYTIGEKQYELSNHLGNVLAVISDWKVPVISGATVVSYTSIVISSQDYSPFGVTLSGRSWSEGYRYGFNGMEKDNDIADNILAFESRMYNAYLALFLSIDPLVVKSPHRSPYSFADLCPILMIDELGEDPIVGQIVILPNGKMNIQLSYNGFLVNKFTSDLISSVLNWPNISNANTDQREKRLKVQEGFIGIASDDIAQGAIPNSKIQNAMGAISELFSIYTEYEKAEIKKLKEADQGRLKNYLNNVNTVNYIFKEAVWLIESLEIANNSGALESFELEKHGTEFLVDVANYALLKNTDMGKLIPSMKFNGNLGGLTSKEYVKKLSEAYKLLQEIVHKDLENSVKTIKVNESGSLGGREIFKFISKITLQLKSTNYKKEPMREAKL